MTILQVTAPTATVAQFHTVAKRSVTVLTTLVRYTVNGAYDETYNPSAVPSNALIHGRVTR